MTDTKLHAYVFDMYGTVVDFATLTTALGDLAERPGALIDTWRQKQLAYSHAATIMDRYVDFDTLTGLALDYAAAVHRVPLDPTRRAALIDAWSQLPTYPEVPEVLAALRQRGHKLAILSNGTPQALSRTTAAAGIDRLLDAVLSVDAVRAYKPAPAVYRLAVDALGYRADQIGFVSSNGWDATGAAEFGLVVHWCNRFGAPAETFGKPPARVIASLRDLLG
ncbi:MAG: haloacid dehalogenase type II [Vulcanimicrobiaceae bacterium]